MMAPGSVPGAIFVHFSSLKRMLCNSTVAVPAQSKAPGGCQFGSGEENGKTQVFDGKTNNYF
ncbi:MAG: hypothetical protein FWH52_06660 [Synergistaceae bacterium]|nr:hypothetical protein [Synergistaceae bacterium]